MLRTTPAVLRKPLVPRLPRPAGSLHGSQALVCVMDGGRGANPHTRAASVCSPPLRLGMSQRAPPCTPCGYSAHAARQTSHRHPPEYPLTPRTRGLRGLSPAIARSIQREGTPAVKPVGHENSVPSCCDDLVLMDEAAKDISSTDLRHTVHRFRLYCALGCSKLDPSMRPLRVVVPGVDAKDPVKVSSTKHHDPVQAFPSHCPNEALRDRVGLRRTDRGEDDPRTLGLEHLIEQARVLGVAVSDQAGRRSRPSRTAGVGGWLQPPRLRPIHLRAVRLRLCVLRSGDGRDVHVVAAPFRGSRDSPADAERRLSDRVAERHHELRHVLPRLQ